MKTLLIAGFVIVWSAPVSAQEEPGEADASDETVEDQAPDESSEQAEDGEADSLQVVPPEEPDLWTAELEARMQQAVALFEQEDFDQALVEFRALAQPAEGTRREGAILFNTARAYE